MPRRKPTTVVENRATLGDYERRLESDRIAVSGLQAAATALGGIASGIGGLGIGGGILLAGLLYGRDIEKLFQQIVGLYPESGAFLSPEWIANWGENPLDIIEESLVEGNNDEVDSLEPPLHSGSLEGRSPYDVYSIACAGRAAAWTHNQQLNDNITHEEYLELNGWKLYNYPDGEGANSGWQSRHNSKWRKANPKPPMMLTFEQCAQQIAIRITAARRDITYLKYLQENNPSRMANFVDDSLLDWLTYTEPRSTQLRINDLNLASPTPYNYKARKAEGESIIHSYAFWSALP